MAEKILTIKVNADTKQVEASFQNVSKYLNDMAGKASFVTTLEKERARVIRSLGDAYGSLKDKISQLNAIQNENLRGGAAKAVENSAAVSKLNAELQKQLELFGKLRAANLGGIPLPKTTATGDSTSISAMMGAAPKPKPASMYVSGGAIGKLTEETRTYTTVAEARAAADAKVAAGAKNLEKVQRSLFESVVQSTIIYKTFTSALQLVQETLANIPAAGIRMQQAQASATAIFGSAEGLRNLKEVRTLAMEAGQSFISLQEAYGRFAPSAILAGAKQTDVNEAFRDFTKVSTVLHLSTDEVKSLYLALEQMYAKGTVQSEEIKKQLGNVLPGAVEIGAKAWAKYTDSADKSVGAFMAAMKKNEVAAKEFIPQFAKLYAEMFGGVDDAVFNDVRTKFASNLQRMKNEYELFSQDVFKLTESSLNFFVKSVADGLSTVRENLQGIIQLTTTIGAGLAIAGFATLEKNLTTLATTFPRLQKVAAVALNPYLLAAEAAIVAGTQLAKDNDNLIIGFSKFKGASGETIRELQAAYAAGSDAAGDELQKIAQLQESSRGYLLNFGETQVQFSTLASKIWDDFMKSNAEDWADIKSVAIATWDAIGKAAGNAWASITSTLDEWKNKLLSALTAIKDKIVVILSSLKALAPATAEAALAIAELDFENLGTRTQQAFGETYKKTTKELQDAFTALGTTVSNQSGKIGASTQEILQKAASGASAGVKAYIGPMKASVDAYTKEIVDYQKKKNEEARKKVLNLPSNLTEGEGEETSTKALEKAKTKASGVADALSKASQKIEKEVRNSIERQQTLYQQNIISFSDYYNRRKAIIEEGIARENALNRGAAGELRVEDYKKQLEQLEQDRFSASMSQIQETRNLYEEYYNLIGDKESALKIKLEDRFALTKNRLRDEIDNGNIAKQIDLDRINVIEQMTIAEGRLATAKLDISANDAKYEQQLNRVNILRNIGSISELTASKQTAEINKEIIANKEKEIALLQEEAAILASTGQSGSNAYKQKAESIRQAREELEQFKLTADTVSQFFEKQVGDAFENAFVSFSTGASSAKEAFNSFVKDIIAGIAKMVAEEAKTAIVGGLFKSAFGALGSYTGGGFSGNGPLQSYQNLWANGGVGTGLNVGNGKVLNSATYFPNAKVIPFASGGVVAGEAGAEAALPLKRLRNGKLGVQTEGVVSGGNVINISVNVDRSTGEDDAAYAQKIAETIARRVAKEEIASAARPGNINNRVTKFG